MQPIRKITSRTVVLPIDNIDTDQIIPARFLTITTKQGLGAALFADWRKDDDFVLNDPDSKEAEILVTGENFGCGSSREHAPWALLDYGFRIVVSRSIADIFKNNAVKNGLLPVEVDAETHELLCARPGAEVTVDLENQTLRIEVISHESRFPVDGFARHCLLQGVDQLEFLLQQREAIADYESSRQFDTPSVAR